MENRYSRRFPSRVVTVIHRHAMPVAIGVVRNCNRTGLYIETRYQPEAHERCIDFELALSRNGRTWRQSLRGLIVHRDEHGMGLMVEAEEFAEIVDMLRPQAPAGGREVAMDLGALPFH